MLRRLVVRCLRTTSMRFNRGNLRGLTPQASRSLRWNERRLMCQCGARSMAVGAERPGRLAAAPASHDQHPDALPPPGPRAAAAQVTCSESWHRDERPEPGGELDIGRGTALSDAKRIALARPTGAEVGR